MTDKPTAAARAAVAARDALRVAVRNKSHTSHRRLVELVRAYAAARGDELSLAEEIFCGPEVEELSRPYPQLYDYNRAVQAVLMHYWLLDYPPGSVPEFTCAGCYAGSGVGGRCECGHYRSNWGRSQVLCFRNYLVELMTEDRP